MYAGEQYPAGEGFYHVIIPAALQPLRNAVLVIQYHEEYHRQGREGSELPAEGKAVTRGKGYIQKDQVRGRAQGLLRRTEVWP